MEKFKKELGRFLVAGIVVLITDAIIYFALLSFLAPWASKAIAFVFGTTAAYLINKFWTFKKLGYFHKEIIKFAFLYVLTMAVNVGINSLVLFFSNSLFFSYIAATGASASLNFIGQKFFVFNKNA